MRSGVPVHFVVPHSIDDPARVSGGNVYDQHVRDGLRALGCDVRMILVSENGEASAARTFAELPDDSLLLVDGLVAVRESRALTLHSGRLRIVVLAHMVGGLVGDSIAAEREQDALHDAKRIVATSGWTRDELIASGLATPGKVVVAPPGTAPAATTTASASGGRLLCVGVVAPHKGQDLLVRALAELTDVDDWHCTFVGARDAAPVFVDELDRTVGSSGLTRRTSFAGVLTGRALERAFARSDLVVVPSRSESFGMVVSEALARGIPVLATRVGGIPEAMAGSAGGILVPPEDPWALEVVLRQWWASPVRRSQLKSAALRSHGNARPWSETVAVIASTLTEVALGATVSA
jgi:glycosyltransferase involved in cell wall biosynthesis